MESIELLTPLKSIYLIVKAYQRFFKRDFLKPPGVKENTEA